MVQTTRETERRAEVEERKKEKHLSIMDSAYSLDHVLSLPNPLALA
jgi:hypothetical protein